jgi:hypothetical protein
MYEIKVGDYVLVKVNGYSFDEAYKTIGRVVAVTGYGSVRVELIKWKKDKDGYPNGKKLWGYQLSEIKKITEKECLVRMI